LAITVVGFPLGWMTCWTTGIDVDAATWKIALATASYTPNVNTHDFFNDITNELATASGYTAGGAALASPTVTYDSATGQVRFDFTDPSWTFAAALTWRYGIAYIDTAGAASTDPLMCLVDWGASQTVSGTYSVTIDPAGLFAVDFVP
jgi:hypothetical protein